MYLKERSMFEGRLGIQYAISLNMGLMHDLDQMLIVGRTLEQDELKRNSKGLMLN